MVQDQRGTHVEQVYPPDADTYVLLWASLREVCQKDLVLEVGTGSGLIASRLSDIARVIATDINPHAVHLARACGVEVVQTDLFAGLCGQFDLIVFNPPYLPTKPEERIDDWMEYALDGGITGRTVIERFIENAGRVLSPRGRILLLCSTLTGIDEVREIFSRYGYISFITAREKVEDETIVVLRAVRDICVVR